MYFFIYKILISCLIPFALAKIFYRALIKPNQLKYLNERFAFYSKDKKVIWESRKTVWFHCVSVGETKAIFNLIEILLKQSPKTYFLISHGTLTGRETKLPESPRIQRIYLPYDTSGGVKRFLSYYQPNVGFILETELWFNLINQCRLNKVALHLINARLSKKSLKKYIFFRDFIHSQLSKLASIYVRSEDDLKNFSYLTKSKIKIMGNIKFESTPPKGIQKKIVQLRKQFKITDQFILVAGSTRPGEEELLLKLIKKINNSNLILLVVPRHPERFDEVEKIFHENNLEIIRKSKSKTLKKCPRYILGDTMGDLYTFYGLASLAIIGGSILDYGAQNPIEPMSLEIKTAVGPSIYNFKDMVSDAEKNKAILRFNDLNDLEKIIKKLMGQNQASQDISRNARQYIKNSSGSTKKVIELVSQYL